MVIAHYPYLNTIGQRGSSYNNPSQCGGHVLLLSPLGRQRLSVSSNLAWFTEQVPGQPGIHRDALLQNRLSHRNEKQ